MTNTGHNLPRLILLIGLPGSGKSTLAHYLMQENPQRVLISTDTIRGQLFGEESIQGPWPLIWREVQRQFYQAAQDAVQGKVQATIFDATNAVRRNRREVIALAHASGFSHLTGVWLDVPLEICLERNQGRDRQVPESVIHRMHRCLHGAPPSLSEGFTHLLHYRFA